MRAPSRAQTNLSIEAFSMKRNPKGWHSRGYLPHFDSPEVNQHIVFRTIGSLPKSLVDSLPEDPECCRKITDAALDACHGPRPLDDPEAASIVENALRHFDGVRYRLLGWCVMPNHVHVVAEMVAEFPLGGVVRSWKSFTAAQINRRRQTRGPFWAPDYFDRFIRNETDLAETVAYVENNPVVAGLVRRPGDWRWSSARYKERA
jgi:putative transposase